MNFGEGVAAAQPISLYPENPHYFLFGGKPDASGDSSPAYSKDIALIIRGG